MAQRTWRFCCCFHSISLKWVYFCNRGDNDLKISSCKFIWYPQELNISWLITWDKSLITRDYSNPFLLMISLSSCILTEIWTKRGWRLKIIRGSLEWFTYFSLPYYCGSAQKKRQVAACAYRPLEDCLPSYHQCCWSLHHIWCCNYGVHIPGEKKKCKGRHFVAHSLLSASLMSRVQKWQSDTFIPWNWLWEEGGWNGERLWDASASWAVEDYEEERKDRWREDSRSQWGLMITFDLINERKIEVRHRIYWFPPSRTQHGFSRPETQNMQNLEKYKQWKDGWKRIAGYTM